LQQHIKKTEILKREKLVLVEDKITSSILGSLFYMDAENVWNLFKRQIFIKEVSPKNFVLNCLERSFLVEGQ
jgi:hypothetical protein